MNAQNREKEAWPNGQNKPRPIIVKLIIETRYNVRKKVFSQQKKSERTQCKNNGKFNTETHGNSKDGKDRTRVHERVDI